MKRDEGSITLWVLGLTMMVLALGGIGLDLWRVLDVRRELGLLADSAAIAGASAIDEVELRETGEVVLEPSGAESRALAVLARAADPSEVIISVGANVVLVEIRREVDLSLLSLLLPAEDGVSVEGVAEARPTVAP